MKLERHMAVAIGDSLEASSTALHGRGNARLAWFFARVAMTLAILVGAAGPRETTPLGWICVLGAPTALRGAVGRLLLFLVPYCVDEPFEHAHCRAAWAPLALLCCCVQ